jgi:hypothetical protein
MRIRIQLLNTDPNTLTQQVDMATYLDGTQLGLDEADNLLQDVLLLA